MAGHLSDEELDDLEVAFARVDHALQLLDDEQIDPARAVDWLDSVGPERNSTPAVGSNDAEQGALAPVVAFPNRSPTE